MSDPVRFENMFGSVTNDRITYNAIKLWHRGKYQEDIPLRHVTSVRVETTRHLIIGLFLALMGLFTLRYVIGIVPLALGIILIWGSPTVSINTAGRDLRPSKTWPWHKKEAEAFAAEIRKQLFQEA